MTFHITELNTQEVFDRHMADKEIIEFKIKSYKDGLLLSRAKLAQGGTQVGVYAVTMAGRKLLKKAKESRGKGRWKLIHALKAVGYKQQEIALVFGISQSAVSFTLALKTFDPNAFQ